MYQSLHCACQTDFYVDNTAIALAENLNYDFNTLELFSRTKKYCSKNKLQFRAGRELYKWASTLETNILMFTRP